MPLLVRIYFNAVFGALGGLLGWMLFGTFAQLATYGDLRALLGGAIIGGMIGYFVVSVEALRDQTLALADELRDRRRVAMLGRERLVGEGLLDGGQVGANHVLRHRHGEGRAFGVADVGGHLTELRGLRGAVAALPGDDHEPIPIGSGGEREGGDDAVPPDARDELGHPLAGREARIAGAGPKEGEADRRAVPLGDEQAAGARGHPALEPAAASPPCIARGPERGNVADAAGELRARGW